MTTFFRQRLLPALSRVLLPGCASLEPQYPPQDLQYNESDIDTTIKQWPRISIVVPSYNQQEFLSATLDSLIEQNYPELEIIVIDGDSTDGSSSIIEKYQTQLKYWVTEADTGQANAINKGMLHADGEILAWLNSDDCLMPGALFQIARTFIKQPTTEVVYGHRIMIDKNGCDIGRWILPAHRNFILNDVDFIPQETMFWRKELWQRVDSMLDETFQFALDWDLICRFVDAGAQFDLIPVYLGQFRVHAQQKTQANIEEVGFKEMQQIRERYRKRVASGWLPQKIFFYRRRWSIYSFLLRARIKEILLKIKILQIQ